MPNVRWLVTFHLETNPSRVDPQVNPHLNMFKSGRKEKKKENFVLDKVIFVFILQPIVENVSSPEFTFTFIVTFVIPVFVPGRYVRYKPTFSIFVQSRYKN